MLLLCVFVCSSLLVVAWRCLVLLGDMCCDVLFVVGRLLVDCCCVLCVAGVVVRCLVVSVVVCNGRALLPVVVCGVGCLLLFVSQLKLLLVFAVVCCCCMSIVYIVFVVVVCCLLLFVVCCCLVLTCCCCFFCGCVGVVAAVG